MVDLSNHRNTHSTPIDRTHSVTGDVLLSSATKIHRTNPSNHTNTRTTTDHNLASFTLSYTV